MSVSMCFMYLDAPELGACMWTSIISSCIAPSTIIWCPLSFSLALFLNLFCLMLSIAVSDFLLFPIHEISFSVPLLLICVLCHKVGLIQAAYCSLFFFFNPVCCHSVF